MHEREQRQQELLDKPGIERERLIQAFLRPPLRHTRYREGHGTLADTTHSFREAVAILIDDRGLSARIKADHLGHSGVFMTQDVYMALWQSTHPGGRLARRRDKRAHKRREQGNEAPKMAL